jgi:hypothetical protein
MDELVVWVLIVAVSLVESIGNVLWKVAGNDTGQISWKHLLDID